LQQLTTTEKKERGKGIPLSNPPLANELLPGTPLRRIEDDSVESVILIQLIHFLSKPCAEGFAVLPHAQ
jgi:hypothetical protein